MELQLFEKYRRVIPIPAVPEVSAGKEASDADYEDPDISPPTRTMTELLELVNEKLVVPEHEVASSGGPSASKHRSPEQEDAVYSEDEETEDEDGSDRYDDEPIVKPSKFGSWGNDIGQLSSPFKDGKQPDSPWLMKRSPGK